MEAFSCTKKYKQPIVIIMVSDNCGKAFMISDAWFD
jgi:hypothetical protein